MIRHTLLPALLAMALTIGACGDDTTNPPTSGPVDFPLSNVDYWIYNSAEYDRNGVATGETWQDTARIIGDIVRDGFTGKRIETGYSVIDSSTGSVVTLRLYDIAAYRESDGRLYVILDVLDSTTFFGNRWMLLADPNGTTWTAYDTTMTESTAGGTLTEHYRFTVTKGGTRTVTAKGSPITGTEYKMTATVERNSAGTPSTDTYSATWWIAPKVGIIAYKTESPGMFNGFERVLTNYEGTAFN